MEWIDVTMHGGWQSEAETLPPMLASSIGYLVNEDKKCLRLASTLGADQTFGDVSVIPVSLIVRKVKIHVGK